jgi:hypothetical protein
MKRPGEMIAVPERRFAAPIFPTFGTVWALLFVSSFVSHGNSVCLSFGIVLTGISPAGLSWKGVLGR